MNKKKLYISLVVIIIDQLFKVIVQMNNSNVKVISNFFKIIYHQNEGAAFGILSNIPFVLIIINIIALILIYSLSFSYKSSRLSNLGFGLLLGGVISNLIDRCIFGYVRDYLSFSIFKPIFNIADIGVVIGVLVIIYLTISKNGCEENGNKS